MIERGRIGHYSVSKQQEELSTSHIGIEPLVGLFWPRGLFWCFVRLSGAAENGLNTVWRMKSVASRTSLAAIAVTQIARLNAPNACRSFRQNPV